MTRLAAVFLIAAFCAPVAAAPRRLPPSKELTALEAKLHGDWTGQGPCTGRLTIHANGTYERTHQGPAGDTSAGSWKVRWDDVAPTLVLTCKTSDDEEDQGRVVELKIVRLDDEGLEFAHAGDPATKKPVQYARAGK